ncbi:MAG TPA: sulfur oxidation c-type cytochrome SoxX [Casimicrobiaceae bacterium]|nr:sulfur oxidation c-type cytochrome SoxX [Casimicrobiaceae bacterium]
MRAKWLSLSVAVIALAMTIGVARGADSQPPSALKVVGDGIPDPVAATPGDAARGRSLMLARDPANCLLCHAMPDPAARFAGDLGPPLAGIGGRLTIPQLRLRVADIIRLNPATIMPSYYRVDGLSLVASAYRGKPILTAAEIEDVVAYLATLR